MDILPERYPMRSRDQCKSNGQYLLGRVLRSIYGQQAMILEEFPVVGERLWLDFLLLHHNLAFEYQGAQHDKFSKFFHGDKKGFQKSKIRDERKRQWCEINGLVLVEVRGNPTVADVQRMIQEARADD